jgi:hypothetical protein
MLIDLNDVNAMPTNILLTDTDIDENVSQGTLIGTFSEVDDQEDGIYVYSLIGGAGSNDNDLLYISGAGLYVTGAIDYEMQTSLSIRVNLFDQLFNYQKVFSLTVNNLNDNTPVVDNGTATISELSTS